MDANVKSLWISALRSNEYRQGFGRLHNIVENSYCCLGVLCDVAVQEGVDVSVVELLSSTMFDGHSADLPDSVVEWAKIGGFGKLPEPIQSLDGRTGGYAGQVFYESLSQLNDSEHFDFHKMADIIENMFPADYESDPDRDWCCENCSE